MASPSWLRWPLRPPVFALVNEFPRFGLSQFARRFPNHPGQLQLELTGDTEKSVILSADQLRELPRIEQISDFHCVTTWTRRSLRCWGGYRFSDLYQRIVFPQVCPQPNAECVVFRCQDGYTSSLPLGDLLVAG